MILHVYKRKNDCSRNRTRVDLEAAYDGSRLTSVGSFFVKVFSCPELPPIDCHGHLKFSLLASYNIEFHKLTVEELRWAFTSYIRDYADLAPCLIYHFQIFILILADEMIGKRAPKHHA
jgi:hypothetical protein